MEHLRHLDFYLDALLCHYQDDIQHICCCFAAYGHLEYDWYYLCFFYYCCHARHFLNSTARRHQFKVQKHFQHHDSHYSTCNLDAAHGFLLRHGIFLKVDYDYCRDAHRSNHFPFDLSILLDYHGYNCSLFVLRSFNHIQHVHLRLKNDVWCDAGNVPILNKARLRVHAHNIYGPAHLHCEYLHAELLSGYFEYGVWADDGERRL